MPAPRCDLETMGLQRPELPGFHGMTVELQHYEGKGFWSVRITGPRHVRCAQYLAEGFDPYRVRKLASTVGESSVMDVFGRKGEVYKAIYNSLLEFGALPDRYLDYR